MSFIAVSGSSLSKKCPFFPFVSMREKTACASFAKRKPQSRHPIRSRTFRVCRTNPKPHPHHPGPPDARHGNACLGQAAQVAKPLLRPASHEPPLEQAAIGVPPARGEASADEKGKRAKQRSDCAAEGRASNQADQRHRRQHAGKPRERPRGIYPLSPKSAVSRS